MKKVNWYPDKVIYFLDEKEDIFKENYFVFCINREPILDSRFVIHVNEDLLSVTIYGIFGSNVSLKANGIHYLYDYSGQDEIDNAGVDETEEVKVVKYIELDDMTEIETDFYYISTDDDFIHFTVPEKKTLPSLFPAGYSFDYDDEAEPKKEGVWEPIPFQIQMFTNENFPDHPHKKKKATVPIKIPREKNIIYRFVFNNVVYTFKDEPKFYWSNIKDLKEFIKDLKLELIERTEEQYFKLIQEKSGYLKKRFGLNQEHVDDTEFYPMYKKLINLYCVENLISLSFINGNFIMNGGTYEGLSSLKLGNFSTGQDGGTNGQIFSPQAIRLLIHEAERELKEALMKHPSIAFTIKDKGGCCVKRILQKQIQGSFEYR